ncbi:uncharacterized protein LOC141908332 [Tubulanus polymorphus]|uniref:uncharacterized protein LOC141908332 n=1 Tax=Tubulanus polymorphus TaxID=672921 RepID=UPI003DA28619
MSSYLGPETPRPFAVISESFQDRLKIPKLPECGTFSFGETYEKRMCELIHRYLELDTFERLCYVGEIKGSLAPMIQERFCLLEPVMSVAAGNFHYEKTDSDKLLPFRIAYTGAEEYFEKLKPKPTEPLPLFDKVLLHNATQYFQNPRATYKNIMKSVAPAGKMVIVHRAFNLNTLPYFENAKERIKQSESPYIDIVKDLQACGLDVHWDVELVPIVMPKVQWLSMVKGKFPCQLEVISDGEITTGIREISEGMLKYEGQVVEFTDRLMFITASIPVKKTDLPKIQRHGQSDVLPNPPSNGLKFRMEVPPDLKTYVNAKKTPERKRLEMSSWNQC